MTRDITPFGLRMPAELKRRIDAAAKASGRSINSEIIDRLQRSFQASTTITSDRAELQTPSVEEIKRQNEEIKAMLRQLLDRT